MIRTRIHTQSSVYERVLRYICIVCTLCRCSNVFEYNRLDGCHGSRSRMVQVERTANEPKRGRGIVHVSCLFFFFNFFVSFPSKWKLRTIETVAKRGEGKEKRDVHSIAIRRWKIEARETIFPRDVGIRGNGRQNALRAPVIDRVGKRSRGTTGAGRCYGCAQRSTNTKKEQRKTKKEKKKKTKRKAKKNTNREHVEHLRNNAFKRSRIRARDTRTYTRVRIYIFIYTRTHKYTCDTRTRKKADSQLFEIRAHERKRDLNTQLRLKLIAGFELLPPMVLVRWYFGGIVSRSARQRITRIRKQWEIGYSDGQRSSRLFADQLQIR